MKRLLSFISPIYRDQVMKVAKVKGLAIAYLIGPVLYIPFPILLPYFNDIYVTKGGSGVTKKGIK